jgi:hypothetical protein
MATDDPLDTNDPLTATEVEDDDPEQQISADALEPDEAWSVVDDNAWWYSRDPD